MNELLNAKLAVEFEEGTRDLDAVKTLQLLADKYPGRISFSTSFGLEDQVITDMIYSHNIPIKIFTLDTGRLFEETYKVQSQTLSKYGKKILVYHPEQEDVEKLMTDKGPYSFYESIDNRKECCHIRKVKPLQKALHDVSIWVTGLRHDQSPEREKINKFIFDASGQIIKFNPLLEWTFEEVKQYINDHHVPYNVLHDKGFISIGCAPCTRAIEPGQDFRAGRWWWENNNSKECGIHTNSNINE